MQEQIKVAQQILTSSVHEGTKVIRLSTVMAQVMASNAQAMGVLFDDKQQATYQGIPLLVEPKLPQGLHVLSQNWI